ncbi:MAG: S8 family serine peptidase [Fimbriimonadales bacterium]|nr:S8 family serine peptidase [Fimbriimonadales bacterium]
MRSGWALLGLTLVASAWAQGVLPPRIAYDAERNAYYVADELVVGLEPAGATALAQQAIRWVGRLQEVNVPLRSQLVRVEPHLNPNNVREFLLALPGVRYVERNYLAFACSIPNDPLFAHQWGLTRIQASQAWAIWQPQRTVYIAIVDTGVDGAHPDLSQKMRRHSNGAIYGYNALANSANAYDGHGHGTHCAGIAAAQIGNGMGIAGVAGWNPALPAAQQFVQVMPVKVLNDQGYGSFSDVARGVVWAADNGAQVISLSLGGTAGTQQLADAVNYAWNRGCLVVAAAGNNGNNAPFYPAAYENAVAVAATDPADRLTSFSQFGAWVDIAAPGEGILSTVLGGGYQSWSGTSMACPHVAGAAALIWAHVPSLTNRQLRTVLENNADPYQPHWYGGIGEGKGRLNVWRALQAAIELSNMPTLSQLNLLSSSVQAGGTVHGTVTLSRAASAGGVIVQLQSSNPSLAWCAETIVIPQGHSTGAFTVTTHPAGVGSVVISATAGGITRSATLQITPAFYVQAVSLVPTTVIGGQSVVFTVHLNAPAPAGGLQVALSSSAMPATLPASITVPEGRSTASVRVATNAVSATTRVALTASLHGSQASAELTIYPPAPVSLTVSPSTVRGGQSATATLVLSHNAPADGLHVRISSSHPNRLRLPQSVYVRPGARTAQFTVQTLSGRIPANVTITVATDSGARSATLGVR